MKNTDKLISMEHKLSFNLKTNAIVCGDCEEWLKYIPSNSIDLIYIDPPFFSNANYEIIWGNGFEKRSFGDRWEGGISHYIEWMRPKIREAKRVLRHGGSIYLHCDWHANHRLRCLLDDVFGENNFVNEIVYKSGPKKNDKNKQKFPVQHNTLLFYKKEYLKKINTYTEHNPEYVKKMYIHKDNKGVFRTAPLSCETKSGGYAKQKVFLFEGINKRWIYSMKTLQRLKKEKRLYRSKNGNLSKKIYLSESKGRALSTIWEDIPIYLSDKEKIGYNTQKPESLIKRLIKASSKENDIVLDFFAGGGTTAKVCADLNRRFIVGDVSPVAVRVIGDRLISHGYNQYEVKSLPSTKEEYLLLDGHKFADMICEFMGWDTNPKKTGDGGIDGWADQGTVAIQVKNHRNNVGRPEIQKFLGALTDYDKGFFVAWGFSPSAWEYRAKVKTKDIKLIKVEDILGSLLLPMDKRIKQQKLYEKRVKNDRLKPPRTLSHKPKLKKVA